MKVQYYVEFRQYQLGSNSDVYEKFIDAKSSDRRKAVVSNFLQTVDPSEHTFDGDYFETLGEAENVAVDHTYVIVKYGTGILICHADIIKETFDDDGEPIDAEGIMATVYAE